LLICLNEVKLSPTELTTTSDCGQLSVILVYLYMCRISCALGCRAYVLVWWEEGPLRVECLAIFHLTSRLLYSSLCISVTGACLLGSVGVLSRVVRFCERLLQSPSWKLQDVSGNQPPHSNAVVNNHIHPFMNSRQLILTYITILEFGS